MGNWRDQALGPIIQEPIDGKTGFIHGHKYTHEHTQTHTHTTYETLQNWQCLVLRMGSVHLFTLFKRTPLIILTCRYSLVTLSGVIAP